jgi:hypothetical protein
MPRFRRSRCRGFGVHDAVNFAARDPRLSSGACHVTPSYPARSASFVRHVAVLDCFAIRAPALGAILVIRSTGRQAATQSPRFAAVSD